MLYKNQPSNTKAKSTALSAFVLCTLEAPPPTFFGKTPYNQNFRKLIFPL
jgi:hypothetical protein